MSNPSWREYPAAGHLFLKRDEAHVWRVSLVTEDTAVSSLRGVLSPDECEKADRFHFRKDRDAFTITRAVLRLLLGQATQRDPLEIRFEHGPQGKPMLPAGFKPDVRFNVSHSNHIALIAIVLEKEVGVDVEFIRSLRGDKDIPERFFSPREVAALRALPEGRQEEAFFACWTRKEAYIKARGGGLSIPLDQFDVSLAPDAPAALLEVRGDPREARRWGMCELKPGEGYAAAIVCEGRDWELQCWEWRQGWNSF